MKKVSADTITELTTASGFSGPQTAPPATQELIDQIRANLTSRMKSLQQLSEQSKKSEVNPKAPPSAFEISYREAVKDLKEFEEIIANVPEGFRLTPVLYSKIDQDQNEDVRNEYRRYVRRHFLKFLGDNHASELRKLGISETGIERMKNGHDPVDDKGIPYAINIDHIIERAGGGNLSLRKEVDPLLPPGSKPTFIVNHINNLLFIPIKIHEVKNTLNELQEASSTQTGKSKWVLMLIPETGPGRAGYVATSQPPNHPLHGVDKMKKTTANTILHTIYKAEQAGILLNDFRRDPKINDSFRLMQSTASRQGKTIPVLLMEEERQPVPPGRSLRHIFNNAVEQNPAQKQFLDIRLRLSIFDLTRQLKASFEEAVLPGTMDGNRASFVSFYNGKKFKKVRKGLTSVPVDEALQLNALLGTIDKALRSDFNASAKLANDNRQGRSRTNQPRRRNTRRNRHHGR